MNWSKFLDHQLSICKQKILWRERQIIEKNDTRILIKNQKRYINFSSNDYLGLSHNPKIIKAWKNGLNQYGAGSGGSSYIVGYTCAHAKLEEQLADWLGYQCALLFISGYSANQSVISTLMSKNDQIIVDKLSHASIMEAAMLSPATLRRFTHNKIDNLQSLLFLSKTGKTLVITEGIFSMNGDVSPLTKLQVVVNKTQAWLLVDDAHGIGVVGNEGRGSCDLYKIKPNLLIITFGKAFGISGAALLCDKSTADYFIQYNRHLIYSTSMPPAQAVALSEALKEIRQGEELRVNLRRNIDYFRLLAKKYNFPLLNSFSAIQPLIIGDNQRCLYLSKFLRQRGFWVQAIRPPTVAPGSSRLRITLMSNHQLPDIAQLMETLNEFFDNYADK